MLRFITKSEYWKAEDDGIFDFISPAKTPWHLKSIQDAIAMSWLKDEKGRSVAEVGGGHSRVLDHLAKSNSVTNIDKFAGSGNGPTSIGPASQHRIVKCNMGDFDSRILDESFDILFSISVVEHVPTDSLESFHVDCMRVLRIGGTVFHLIDVYLADTEIENSSVRQRVQAYRLWFGQAGCQPVGTILKEQDIKFSCSYASNPDNVLNTWNRQVPALRTVRERAQSVSLLFAGTKTSR